MKQAECKVALTHRRKVNLILLIIAMGCENKAPPSKTSLKQDETAKPTDVYHTQNIGAKTAMIQRESESARSVGNPCDLDQRGLIQVVPDPVLSKERRIAAWQREFDIQSPKALQELLPVFGDSHTFALTSAELFHVLSGGRPFDGSCIRFRYLSIEPPNKTVARLINDHHFTVLNTPSGRATILVSKDQQRQLSVGTNENLTTQIDGVLRLKSGHTFESEQFIDQTSAVSSISQIMPGIEYGIYSSGRRGLKFAGLERITWRTRQTAKETVSRIERAGFSRIEDSVPVWKKHNETYTFRTYETGKLSIFWQKKWTQKDWAKRFSRREEPGASPSATPKPLTQ